MPNWYQKEKLKQIARPALMMAPLGLGLGLMNNGKQAPIQEPPAIEQRVPATQPTTQPTSRPSTQPSTQPAATQPTTAPASQPTTAPSTQPAEPTGDIDVKKIIQMESSGRPKAVSPVGAAGLMQVMPATWEDIANKIGKYQGFEKYKFDETANVAIGSYYMNKEIPRLLKAMGLPDTIDMRLAAYNYGVGNVKKVYKQHGDKWREHLPTETANYLKKYRGEKPATQPKK
jgi:hypothetical protein